MAATTGLTVGILTFKRCTSVAACATAVLAELSTLDHPALRDGPARIVIVDNDPSGSARTVIASIGSPAIAYVVEPEPGIAAARNRVLRESAGSRFIVFVDDDELPDDGWLDALLDTWASTGAAAVTGRVISEFETELSPWVTAGGFFARRNLMTGTPVMVAATNNLLLDMDQVSPLSLRFDLSLGLTGGEDTMFSRQMTDAGAVIVWSAKAIVRDIVPARRSTARWVLLRACSSGNSAAVVDLLLCTAGRRRTTQRVVLAGRGILRAVIGLGRAGIGLMIGSMEHQARGLRTAARGAGLLTGAMGLAYQEYGRDGGRFQLISTLNSKYSPS